MNPIPLPPNGKGSKITIGNVLTMLVIVVGLGVSFGTLQSTLIANRAVIERLDTDVRNVSLVVDRISRHQSANEFLIDQHSGELEEIERLLKIRIARHYVASPAPAQ